MTTWSVWSWDGQHKTWMEVAEGPKRDMTAALDRHRSAAARLMPSARFTMTRQDQPPTEAPLVTLDDLVPPEDQEA